MGIIFKPLKLVLFALAVFGILSMEVKDKKIITHLSDWITSKRGEQVSDQLKNNKGTQWAKDKAKSLLGSAKDKISESLSDTLSNDDLDLNDFSMVPPDADVINTNIKKSKDVGLIEGTSIPKSAATSKRKEKIIQKLNIENEIISGDDKRELKDTLGF